MEQKSNKFTSLIAKLTRQANRVVKKKNERKKNAGIRRKDVAESYKMTQFVPGFPGIKLAD